MEILQIAKGRLKVTLTAEELNEYAVDIDGMAYDGSASAQAFEEILAVVCAKTDLKTDRGQTYVQVYPSKEGGCELFFIHIDAEDDAPRALVPLSETQTYLCFFEQQEQMTHFLQLCRQNGGRTSVFLLPERNGYVVLAEKKGESGLFLREHGVRVDRRAAYYLEEHLQRPER